VQEKDLLLDKRIVERNIKQGRISREQYEQALKALPNLAKKSTLVVSEVAAGAYKVDYIELEE